MFMYLMFLVLSDCRSVDVILTTFAINFHSAHRTSSLSLSVRTLSFLLPYSLALTHYYLVATTDDPPPISSIY